MRRGWGFILGFMTCATLLSCTSNTKQALENEITISVSDSQAMMLYDLVENFNVQYEGKYEVKLNQENSEEIKNYKLEHHAISSDIIAFDSFNTANQFGSDYLIDLTLDDTVEKYQTNIINYIKDNKERLFCFPSLGRFYANCYNIDIMNKYSFSIPETLDDELILAKRSELKVTSGELTKTSATIGGEDSILFALMQVAFPEFLGTTTGSYFLKEFKKENVNMSDAKYSDYFKDIFKKFHQLYYSSYYSLDDYNLTIDDGISEFLESKTMVLQTSLDYQYDDVIENMNNAVIYPFAGSGVGQEWIASKPLFYLAVNKNIAEENYPCAKAFFKYFTSKEGQDLMSESSVARMTNNKCYISYVKDIYLELGENYEKILKPIEDGRIFIVDNFFQIFGENVPDLINYLNNSISIDELINIIDKRSYKKLDDKTKISIQGEFDFDQSFGLKESVMGNYFSDILRKYANTDALILDSNTIKCNIYQDGIYLSEFATIFENKKLAYKKLSILELKKIIKYYLEDEIIPLISGLRITLNNDELVIYDQTNKMLNDSDSMIVLVDEDALSKNQISYQGDKVINLVDTITKIMSNQTNIVAPKQDGRYGNIDFSKENE